MISQRVPLSTTFGRRPVYLASTLLCFVSAILRAEAKTYGSFMGASILNGLAAGPAEVNRKHHFGNHITAEHCNQTIMPNVIADTMFLHERGAYNTLYFAFYFGSLMVS